MIYVNYTNYTISNINTNRYSLYTICYNNKK